MPSHHEKPGAKKEPAGDSNEVTKDQCGEGNEGLTLIGALFNPPKSPAPQQPSPEHPDRWYKDRKFILECLGFLVLLAYTVFSCLQWLQIRWTNRLTREALDGNGYALNQTLGKMQAQVDATNSLYAEAQKQTGSAATIAGNSDIEAGAAKNSANVATETLNVAERAYISVTSMSFEFASGNVLVSFVNTGHIPSGQLTLEAFEATSDIADPSINNQSIVPIEKHWHVGALGPIPGASMKTYRVSIPHVTESAVSSGHQAVYVGVRGTYDDGIPTSKPQSVRYVGYTIFDNRSKQLGWFEGDPVEGLDRLVKAVGYPKNQEGGSPPM